MLYKTPECVRSCDNSSIKYEDDLIRGQSGYILQVNETQIQQEILKNGPVVSTFDVFTDFLHYKSGKLFILKISTRAQPKMFIYTYISQ